MTQPMKIKGIILAGGPSKGTRFRPLSLCLPKALFPLSGIPMIEHHIDALCRVPNMVEILIIGLYDPSVFEAYIESKKGKLSGAVSVPDIKYLKEPGALGTAGGLVHFHQEIMQGDPEHFYFLHVDICSSFPLLSLLETHKRNVQAGAVCTMMGHSAPDRSASLNYGCIVRDNNSRVIHYVEKPDTFVSDLINCGVYLFHTKEVFRVLWERLEQRHPMEADPDDLVLDKTGTDAMNNASRSHMHTRSNSLGKIAVKEHHLSLEQDILVSLSEQGRLFVYETLEFWCQIKTSESTLAANRLYLDHYAQVGRTSSGRASPSSSISTVYIHETAMVHETAKIGPNVSIGEGCLVGKGVRLRDCILLSNVVVEDFSCVKNSILGWSSHIGMWSRIEGKPEDTATHKRPSVTILAGDVMVHPEVMIRQCIVLPHKELKASFHDEIIM